MWTKYLIIRFNKAFLIREKQLRQSLRTCSLKAETLQEMQDAGVQMAVVSNCQEGYIPAFIASMDMGRYFVDYEEWGRSGLLKADNIRLVMSRNGADKAVYVGDIQKDADASAEAGVPCIWAAYGFGHIEEPAAVLRKFSDLPDALRELGFMD